MSFERSATQELVAIIEAGPDLAEHGVVRFRLRDLCALVEERFGVTYGEQGLSKLIKNLGFHRISARPQHPKSEPEIQAEYKKKFHELVGDAVGDRAAECPIEIWFADKARVGQKGQLTRQ